MIADNGVISVTGGTLTLNGPVSGSGTLLVGADAALRLNGSVSASDAIVQSGTDAGLEIGVAAVGSYPMQAAISGFAAGDSLMFHATVATGATYVATGVNRGTLGLFNGTTQVAAVTLAGGYAGDSFVLSPTTNGAEVVSILTGGAAGGDPVSGSGDTYSWIETSGDSFGSGSNWVDVTGGGVPAGLQPGGQTPVVIAAPGGVAYEVISGGGAAANILQTGLVALSGHYSVGGLLSVGTTAGAPVSTPGSLLLGAGSELSAGAVALNSGTIVLAAASLGVSGTMTVGLPNGFVLPSGLLYVGGSGGSGVVNVGAGASLAVGGLAVISGSLMVGGTAARAVLGALSLGSAPTGGSGNGAGAYTSPDDLGSPGTLLVDAGGSVAIAGGLTEADGVIAVSGSLAVLTVGGTMSLQGGSGGRSLDAMGGATVRAAGLAWQRFGANTAAGGLYIDSMSTVEIGTLGSAVAGVLTIDPGATVSAEVNTSLQTPAILDNGVIDAAGGTLTLNGPVSGSGTLLVGADASLRLNGSVSDSASIVLTGMHAGLEIGVEAVFNNGSYALAPYSVRAPISGFAIGDSLMFVATEATGATYVATGVNLGLLELFNGATQVAAVTLAGKYAGDTFFLSPATNGSEVVSILAGGSAGGGPLSSNSDTYSWIGTSGGSFGSGSNWADVTDGSAPAGSQPGGQNKVVIAAPGGGAYEVISGGGSAAEILQTGLVALSGSYGVVGLLSVGTPETVAAPSSLLLEAGSALQAGSVALNSGTITLGGASLSVSGTMTAGLPAGFVLPNESLYLNGSSGVVSVGSGGSLTVVGGLAVASGGLVVGGTLAHATLGALSLGSAPSAGVVNGAGDYTVPYDLGSLAGLSIGAGGTVTVAESVTEPDGVIAVSGTQALLDVGGTWTLQGGVGGIAGYSLDAIGGGVVRAGGLAFAAFGANAVAASFYTDSVSTVEIGTLGGAAAGALTVDAGATVSAATSALLLAPLIVDNGVISVTGGTLTLNGPVSGSGTLLVGADAALRLNGSVSASASIVLSGMHAGLEIGVGTVFNDGSYTLAPYPIASAIRGFAAGDSLMFVATVATGATYVPTGVNLGMLELFNGITQVAAVTLAGSYAGNRFFLSATTNGAEVVSILPVESRTLVWTGALGGDFADPLNWNDTSDGTDPAVSPPGSIDVAAFTNAGGVITGGGTAVALSFGGDGAWHLASGASLVSIGRLSMGTDQAAVVLINGGARLVGSADAIIAAAAGSDGSSEAL
jgi:hypothetical protein